MRQLCPAISRHVQVCQRVALKNVDMRKNIKTKKNRCPLVLWANTRSNCRKNTRQIKKGGCASYVQRCPAMLSYVEVPAKLLQELYRMACAEQKSARWCAKRTPERRAESTSERRLREDAPAMSSYLYTSPAMSTNNKKERYAQQKKCALWCSKRAPETIAEKNIRKITKGGCSRYV